MEKIPIDPISFIINPSNRGRNLEEYFILDERSVFGEICRDDIATIWFLTRGADANFLAIFVD